MNRVDKWSTPNSLVRCMYGRRKQRSSIVQFGFGTCLEHMLCKTLDRCRCMSQQHTGHKPTARQILGTSRENMACMQSDECRCCKNQQDTDYSSTARCRADESHGRMPCTTLPLRRYMSRQRNKCSQSDLLSSDRIQLDMWCMNFDRNKSCTFQVRNIRTQLIRLRIENDQRGSSCKASVEGRGGKRVNKRNVRNQRRSCG